MAFGIETIAHLSQRHRPTPSGFGKRQIAGTHAVASFGLERRRQTPVQSATPTSSPQGGEQSRTAGQGRGGRHCNPLQCRLFGLPQSLTQAPLRFEDATQASTKATPFTPSSTVG
jgi:hypothetical protein